MWGGHTVVLWKCPVCGDTVCKECYPAHLLSHRKPKTEAML